MRFCRSTRSHPCSHRFQPGHRLGQSLHPKAKPQYDQGAVDPSASELYHFASVSLGQSAASPQPASPHSNRTRSRLTTWLWLTPQQYADRFGLSPNDLQQSHLLVAFVWLRDTQRRRWSKFRNLPRYRFPGTECFLEPRFITTLSTVNGTSQTLLRSLFRCVARHRHHCRWLP